MKTDVLVVGGGVTGMACAYYLKCDYELFEKEDIPGGTCNTDMVGGFRFDRAEHFIRIPNAKTLKFFRDIMGNNFFSQELVSSIYYDKRFIPYPFQKNLYYLSNRDKLRCLKSFIKTRFRRERKREASFGEWIFENYGKEIARIFMIPYNKKMWQTDPFQMKPGFIFSSELIPRIRFEEMLEYTLLSEEERHEEHHLGRYYLKNRYYLKQGGIGAFSKKLAARIKNAHYGKELIRLNLKRKEASFSDGTVRGYERLVSTIPLNELVAMTEDIPSSFKKSARQLRYTSIRILNFALKREAPFRQHWIYVPERKAPFARIYFMKNFNNSMCPKGKSSISALHAYLPHAKPNLVNVESRIREYLVRHGFFARKDIEFTFRQSIRHAMAVPTLKGESIVNRVDKFLKRHSVKTIGRYGLWKYQGMEHAVEDGQNINETIKDL